MDILEIFSYMVVIVVPLLFIITTIDHLIILNKLKKQEEILFRLGIQNRMNRVMGTVSRKSLKTLIKNGKSLTMSLISRSNQNKDE